MLPFKRAYPLNPVVLVASFAVKRGIDEKNIDVLLKIFKIPLYHLLFYRLLYNTKNELKKKKNWGSF